MSQDYDRGARERPLSETPSGPAPSGRRELPVWLQYVGVIIPLTDRPGTDLRSYSGEIYPVVQVLRKSAELRYGEDVTEASFAKCRSITGYSEVGVSFRGSKAGDVVCVHTDERRFSRLKFVSYDYSTGVLTLVVTTWEEKV